MFIEADVYVRHVVLASDVMSRDWYGVV